MQYIHFYSYKNLPKWSHHNIYEQVIKPQNVYWYKVEGSNLSSIYIIHFGIENYCQPCWIRLLRFHVFSWVVISTTNDKILNGARFEPTTLSSPHFWFYTKRGYVTNFFWIQFIALIRKSLTWLKLVICPFGFGLKPIFVTDPAVSKNDAHCKSGQKWLENNHLASLVWIRDTSWEIPHNFLPQFVKSLNVKCK